jgi:hypothetical protein
LAIQSARPLSQPSIAYLEDLGELSGSNVGIDVQNLTFGILGQTSQDGQTTSFDSSFNRSLVDSSDFANKTVFGLVEVFGREDTSGDRSGACTESLESGSEFEVLL